MLPSFRLLATTTATLALSACTTLTKPARTEGDAVSQGWNGRHKNGYLGLTMNFETPGVAGETCLLVSLENQVDKTSVDTRVCDRDFEETSGQRGGGVLFAVPPGRYAVKAAWLSLPGNFGGVGHRTDSQLLDAPSGIEVAPHGFAHLATVKVSVSTKGSGSRTLTAWGETVSFGRPKDAQWKEFAGLLRTLPSRYLADNGEQRPLDWSFPAE